MTETTTPPDDLRLPRCCPAHKDWPTLAQHLSVEFPEVSLAVLVRELNRSREAVDSVSLEPQEALRCGELILRHQLMLLSGRSTDVARLDPERHRRTG